METEFDVLIVGGGLVGSCLAIALADCGRRVGLIEAEAERTLESRWDQRHFALAEASRLALSRIGVWSGIAAPTPIAAIHVTRAGEFGRVLFKAMDYQVPALGYTVPASQLQHALRHRLDACRELTRLQPARVLTSEIEDNRVSVSISCEGETRLLRTALLVAADGTHSALRQAVGIDCITHDYQQTAVVAALRLARPHRQVAYERLTSSGPLAVLPIAERDAGLIYTRHSAEAEAVLALDDQAFLTQLARDLRGRLGPLQAVGRRQGWPLRLLLASRITDRRLVLIGNAAQTIHPLGAQGFNLGLRDAMALAELVAEDRDDAGAAARLQRYAERRAADRDATIRFSHGLVQLTGPDATALQFARWLGMTALAHLAPLKERMAFAAMGFRA